MVSEVFPSLKGHHSECSFGEENPNHDVLRHNCFLDLRLLVVREHLQDRNDLEDIAAWVFQGRQS
jgi:hypothetical protein